MGQQQLLLIVLGVIIVGIAIVVGINLFTASSVEANKDALVADNMNIASLAQQYFKKPSALAGGNGSFTGFEIPSDFSSNPNGTYTAVVAANSVTITGKGNVQDSDGKVYQVVTTVTPNDITTAAPTLVTP